MGFDTQKCKPSSASKPKTYTKIDPNEYSKLRTGDHWVLLPRNAIFPQHPIPKPTQKLTQTNILNLACVIIGHPQIIIRHAWNTNSTFRRCLIPKPTPKWPPKNISNLEWLIVGQPPNALAHIHSKAISIAPLLAQCGPSPLCREHH